MAGFNPDFFPANVYNLIADNIKLNEIKRDSKESEIYGINHLFNNVRTAE